MKIGVYARGLSEESGGVRQYIESITNGLIQEIGDKDELFIIHNLPKKYFNSNKKNVREILLNSKSKLICDFIMAPKTINKLKLDSVFFTKNLVPYFVKCKKIVTIHDLAYYMPEFKAYKFSDTLYWKFMIKSSCKRADKIIAISENTKKDIINIVGIEKDKIKVVYEAADSKYKKITYKRELEKVKEKYNLKNSFIFYSGSLSPRKNIQRSIIAFNEISNKTDYDFVLTGNKIWNSNNLKKLIENNSKIRVLGFVKDEDMPYLYNLATVCLYPSLYEGFGLPILEAQACGCAVICSNTSSLPEVGRNSVYYINPNNEKEIGESMIKVTNDKKLRDDLIRKGYKNVKKFSWEKTARETLKVCKEAYNEK